MPKLSVIQSAISELPKGPPIVVALPGGTTGIGSYIARALAATYADHGSKLRVYIVGRNVTRAESLLSDCRKTSSGSEWRFIQTPDLALISEVDRCCAEIVRQETEAPFHGGKAKLDLLYMTYSYPLLKERCSELSFQATAYVAKLISMNSNGRGPGCVPRNSILHAHQIHLAAPTASYCISSARPRGVSLCRYL
jgi:hypothetical protein